MTMNPGRILLGLTLVTVGVLFLLDARGVVVHRSPARTVQIADGRLTTVVEVCGR